ncbi:hypothetical protein M2D63_016980 [Pseudomonas sp. BJa5]|uniref:hypothetical protein n=1 Tax=Pseudomonas sp. BJa5 TaxID=2936270 RepID=UPI00255A1EFD|nr:hypothetical protein [Pseudomonas sp. BGr12]MDL2422814.1 hypothetical protein [Pseudomonas sp. BGr12]
MNDLQAPTNLVRTTLSPLAIYRMATPVEGFDGGVSIDTLATSVLGVLATVPTFRDAQVGDLLQVFMEGEPAPIAPALQVAERDLNRPLSLYLAADRFTPGEKRLYYTFTRQGLEYQRARSLSVWVKLTRPGGEDIDPAPGHQGLVAAEVAANPVTAAHLEAGVDVRIFHYENKAVGDVIRLSWGGIMRTYTLSEADINHPVVINVPGSVILEAGDSPNLVVSWEVHDLVYNTSQAWAPHVSIVVDTGTAQLPVAAVQGVDSDGYLDLEAQGDAPLLIAVNAKAPDFAVGDQVKLRFTGYIDSGLPTHTDLEQVIRGQLPQVIVFSIANDKLWALANGLAVVSYTLVTASGELRSQRLTVGVKGQPQALQAPSVNQAVEGELAYDATRATVMIPKYLGRTAGHEIVLVWLGTMFDGKPTVHEQVRTVSAQQAGSDAPIAINVAAEHIRLLESGSVKLYYRVRMATSRSVGYRESAPLNLTVSTAGLLPLPGVEAPGNQLDPHFFPGGVQVSVDYPVMLVQDTVTLTWQGADAAGTVSLVQTVTQPGTALLFNVPQAVVQASLGGAVQVSYQVEPRDGRPLPSQVLNLAIRSQAPTLTLPTLTGAQGGSYDAMLGLHGAQVRISYTGMRASDRVQLLWQGAPGVGTPALIERPGSDSGFIMASVPPSAVGANINGQVRISYQVLRNELPALDSPVLSVQVRAPAADALVKPTIEQAVGGELELDSFDGPATVTAAPWPFIALDQRVWLEARSGSAVQPLLVASVIDASTLNGLSVELPRAFLTALADGAELSLHLKVNFGATADAGQTVDFPVRSYQVRQGQLHIMVSDLGLATSALPQDWSLKTQTCGLTLIGRPGAQGTLSVNGSAQFDNDSQQLAFTLDSRGEFSAWLGDAFAETVLVSALIDGVAPRYVPVRFSDVFVFDQEQDEQGVRARAAAGALANGRAGNRVCFDARGFADVTYVQVELSGSASIPGHPGQIASLALTELSGDCQFEVVDSVAEEVTLTFHLPQGGSWTRFSKTLYFSSLASNYSPRAAGGDPRPWFMRVNQIKPLDLSALRIPNLREYVDHPDGLHGGIGKPGLENDPKGLQVIVEPYLGMEAGDEIQIYWGDEATPVTPFPYVVKPEDRHELVFIYVPPGRIPNGNSKVWFTVRAANGNDYASAQLFIKVKRSLPGGPNPNPGSPHHTGLMFPIIPPGIIDWNAAQEGISVSVYPWRFMEVGDRLNLSWGGVKVQHVVQPGEVGTIISVYVDLATIEEAGDSEELLVLYWLEDEVGNPSDGASLPSYAFVEISAFLLPRPAVEPLDSEGFIELGELGPQDVTVTVVADFPRFIAGDRLRLVWRGFTSDAVALPVHEQLSDPLPSMPPARRVEFRVANALIQAIAGGLAYVSYRVVRNGFPTPIPSKTSAVGVRGVATQLVRPDVDGRDEDYLPDTLSRVVIRIPPWLAMFPGQEVRVVWQGTKANGNEYVYMEERRLTGAQVGKEVVFVWHDPVHLVAIAGGSLVLFFQVKNASGEPWESERLEVWVGEPAPEFIRPEVEEAENGVLDPVGIVVASTLVPLYTGMAQGQTIHLEWLSPVVAGNWFDYLPVQSARDEYFGVPEENILPSLNRPVRVRYVVREPGERSRNSDYLNLWIGPVLTNPPQPLIEEARGDRLDLLLFPGDALVTVAPWVGINEGQYYWLRCIGVDEAGGEKIITLAERQAIAPGEVDLGIRAVLPRAELQGFAHESRIRLEMQVVLHEDAGDDEAIVFPQRHYQIFLVQVQLVAPFIEEARGIVLELAAFQGDATLRLEPWQGIVQGQVIWITLRGTQGQNTDWQLPLVEAELVSADETVEGFRWSIPRAELDTLSHGTQLTIHAAVNTAGEDDFDAAIEAPVKAYEMNVATFVLAVSSLGMQSTALPTDWIHPKETNSVTVIGSPGEVATLVAGSRASFVGGAQQLQVTLDQNGEAHQMLRATSPYTTVTARRTGKPSVTAELQFTGKFPWDRYSGIHRVGAMLAQSARANGRSRNRVCYDTEIYYVAPLSHVIVSIPSHFQIVGYAGQRVHITLHGSAVGEPGDIYFDVVSTVPGTYGITFELPGYSWARFTKYMTFT